ncbi:MAG TPA: CDP-alcohol phosphatidyltransferase family protein, partial [Gemmatimonadaceae bacterium]|nr:CDP-alcohol phosphatidyltransferase family protein [Gemmatimonadaceae bacterium]
MNLPNAITVARIAATPMIAWLPLVESWQARLAAFVLFVVAAVTDWVDGHLARTRQSETDLGRLLDPLADKLLLVATFVPMFILSAPRDDLFAGAIDGAPSAFAFPFVTPVGTVALPWWVLAVVLGRELFMTIFRQAAARRGTVIAAIGPAKWKTGFQSTWVGAAFFWYFNQTAAAAAGWDGERWWRA